MQNRSEIDLLVECARPTRCDQTIQRLRGLIHTVDWNRLRILAYYHRVHPLLYTRLTERAADLVPESLLADMAADFRARATRNLHLTSELITLTKAFAKAGLPVLPHKGPVLAQAAYRNLAMRQFADLDLLVHARGLPQSIGLLTELGYMPQRDLAWLSPRALLDWTGEMSYSSLDNTVVDLHWRITPSHYTVQLDSKTLWQNLTSIRIAGSEVPAPTPEAHLLLLAVHGAKHCWESIGWLADIAWLLSANPNFDWQTTIKMAHDSKCERPLLLAASLVAKVFDAVVPELPSDPVVARLQQRAISRWYDGPVETPMSPELFSFATGLARRRSDSLKHLVGLLFYPTEKEWSTRRLSESLFWLYVPGRAARLVGKYLRP